MAPRSVFPGILLAGFVSLLMQISLTRLFSATIDYHATFAVIALVMLGLAASGTKVFLQRNRKEPIGHAAPAWAMLAAGGCAAAALLGFLGLGFVDWGLQSRPVHVVAAGLFFYPPFYFLGYAIAYLIAQYARSVSKLYWFDLTGASLGCLGAVGLLEYISPMQAVLGCAALAALSGLLLASSMPTDDRARARVKRATAIGTGLVAALFVASLVAPSIVRLRQAKASFQNDVLWVKWNHLSRVSVVPRPPGVMDAVAALGHERYPNLDSDTIANRWASGWGLSRRYDGPVPKSLYLQIDSGVGTPILKGGDPKMPILGWDVTALGDDLLGPELHSSFVMGAGGGRDVLTALHFGAKNVYAVELNPQVVEAVQSRFGDYSGKPYTSNGAQVHVGEARNVLTNTDRKFDLIQISMVDTFAASSAQFVFTENGLYTLEAYQLFWDHLTDDGVISVSRSYSPKNFGEVGRLLALSGAALRAKGIERPEDHVAVAYSPMPYGGFEATVVTKKSPLTAGERERLADVSRKMGFKVLWPQIPGVTVHDPIDVVAVLHQRSFPTQSNFDLSPPTDDRPFFFNTRHSFSSWIDVLRTGDLSQGATNTKILGLLLIIVLFAGRMFVLKPLQRWNDEQPPEERIELWGAPVAYFAGIGFGFMWIEIAVLQRYIVFLGHPTYALSVVLFSLLLFGGIGAGLSSRIKTAHGVRRVLAAIIVGALLTAFAVPPITRAALGLDHSVRMVIAAGLVAPLATCMGMIYPSGVVMLVAAGRERAIPWVWAVNGVCGVLASVLGMLVAMDFGYTWVLVLAAGAYGATLVSSLGADDGAWTSPAAPPRDP